MDNGGAGGARLALRGIRKVYPAVIANDGIDLAVAPGEIHAVLGEVGRVYVIPKPGSNLREADVRNWCAEHLADYKVPRQVVLRDALPLTPAGKIHKAALRAEA